MLRILSSLIFLSTVFLLTDKISYAQVSWLEAKELAELSECALGKVHTKSKYLRSIRNEDFEDMLFALQEKNSAQKPSKPAFIFRIDETGTFITKENETVFVLSTGVSDKHIAVMRDSGKVFGLNECKDKEKNFQSLIRETKVRVQSVPEARAFGHFYYRVMMDSEINRLIFRRIDFRQIVERNYFNYFSDKKAKSIFKRWSKAFKRFKYEKLGLNATQENDDYRITFTYWHSTVRDERTKLIEDTLIVTSEGEIVEKSSRVLFH